MMKNFIEDSHGKFGRFGGCFAPELLQPVLKRVEEAFEKFKKSKTLQQEFLEISRDFSGRPTPVYHCKNLSQKLGGAQIYVKREDLLHGGAHKTNNVVGQALLAREMGAKFLIAETGAGQHGIATAMAGARFGMPVKIFMGKKDVERQQVNVERMRLLGAKVISVTSGSRSLKDAINEAMRYWIAHSEETFYLFGTAAGPHPFPELVARFHRIIGEEARTQILEKTGKLPDEVLACVGGGSNAIGIFQGFLADDTVKLVGVEPAGNGIKHGQTLTKGVFGCLHGSLSLVNCDKNGQIEESHSISAGLDYPGISPIHAYLQDQKRAEYTGITDDEAVEALVLFARTEGIIPALESAHAIAEAMKRAKHYTSEKILLVNLSGRGDKDLHTVFEHISFRESFI
jgi:tryptophan synthase beta chain